MSRPEKNGHGKSAMNEHRQQSGIAKSETKAKEEEMKNECTQLNANQ